MTYSRSIMDKGQIHRAHLSATLPNGPPLLSSGGGSGTPPSGGPPNFMKREKKCLARARENATF